jgi:hypothetical protein
MRMIMEKMIRGEREGNINITIMVKKVVVVKKNDDNMALIIKELVVRWSCGGEITVVKMVTEEEEVW